MKVVFFGSSSYVIPIINVLNKNFDLSLILTTEKSNGAVPSFCRQNKIEFTTIKQFSNSTIEQLKTIDAPMAIIADFGLIIPKEILSVFPKEIINIHPSLLPKYRGPTPMQTAILKGDKKTGVSIIKLDEQVDHGPILFQTEENILEADTAQTLYERLFKIAANLLPQTINKYVNGEVKPKQQDDSKATYTKTLTRQDGYIDISKIKDQKAKIELDRKIRAFYPWPGAWTRLRQGFGGQAKFKIIKFLPEQKLQVEGKKPMSYKDFLNGYPETTSLLKKIYSDNI